MLSVRIENLGQLLNVIETRANSIPFVKALAINAVAER